MRDTGVTTAPMICPSLDPSSWMVIWREKTNASRPQSLATVATRTWRPVAQNVSARARRGIVELLPPAPASGFALNLLKEVRRGPVVLGSQSFFQNAR